MPNTATTGAGKVTVSRDYLRWQQAAWSLVAGLAGGGVSGPSPGSAE